ncbi:hypothetical protein DFH06DRAFT_1155944 [Mycena polygramma]|nr:hypothetical protein DFH06DRAFT_1155944 [Mycena polygramma]
MPVARTKRKRVGADAEAPTRDPTDGPPPPKKRARRVAKQTTIPIIDVQDSEPEVVVRKGRKPKPAIADQRTKSPKKKTRRVKSPTPPPVTQDGPSSDEAEDASDAVVSSRKRRIRRKVEVQSDSDEAQDEAPRRLRRVKPSSPVDAESDSLADSPRRGRLRRKSDGVKESPLLDSDDDPEDLALPVQPSSSKPTKKQLKSTALQRYAKARKNKSSPAPVPEDASDEEEEEREFTPFSEAEEDDEDEGEASADVEGAEDTFIVDEDEGEGDVDADANAELNRMRYSSRQLDEHFAVFVEYIIALHSDPDYLSTATEDEKAYFDTAVNALRRHIDPLADSMMLSTWKAPFIATLNLRPILDDGLSCEGTGDCHACWTRGMYACDLGGAYTISTRKGIYDHNTFEDLPEKKIKYGKATQFENNAEARNLPYPPRFELIIGRRCFNRALAYHEARHYMYSVALRVREKIKSLCDGDEELANDPNALLEAMKEENYIEYLWGKFKSDRKQWSQWANRKDHDLLG